ncbi:hypothetical protein B0H10DRAFT_1950597 [Mycena sp. CBHHK59/15]|nr:hypothetical protein B0H10DRAFT_1950597 [Mycena sp. CBHHK59/15]
MPSSSPPPFKTKHDSPIRPGQLVYARLLPKISIEGYTIQSQAHPPAWQDPTLSDAARPTTFLPAVVLDTSGKGKWTVKLAALTRRELDAGVVKMQVHGDTSSAQVRVVGAGDLWCVVLCPAHWSLDRGGLDVLHTKVGAPHSLLPDNKMAMLEFRAYVVGQPLNPDTLHGLTCGAVNWASSHAWYDGLVPIAGHRAHDIEWLWTIGDDASELSDNMDITQWRNVQQEREESATLGVESEAVLDAQLGRITVVE